MHGAVVGDVFEEFGRFLRTGNGQPELRGEAGDAPRRGGRHLLRHLEFQSAQLDAVLATIAIVVAMQEPRETAARSVGENASPRP